MMHAVLVLTTGAVAAEAVATDMETIPYMFPTNSTMPVVVTNSSLPNSHNSFYHAYVETKRDYIRLLEQMKDDKMRHLDQIASKEAGMAELKRQLANETASNNTANARIDTLYLMLKKELLEKRLMMESDTELHRVLKERANRLQHTFDGEKEAERIMREKNAEL